MEKFLSASNVLNKALFLTKTSKNPTDRQPVSVNTKHFSQDTFSVVDNKTLNLGTLAQSGVCGIWS